MGLETQGLSPVRSLEKSNDDLDRAIDFYPQFP